MSERKQNKLKPVTRGTVVQLRTPQGSERKQRRLAGVITAPEAARPQLPIQADTSTLLGSGAWRSRWAALRPAADTVSVYVAGCQGAMALGGVLGVPLFKIGTTTDVSARMRKLNQQRYGALRVRDFAIVEEPGWDSWSAARLSAPATHPASPVRVLARELVVEVPCCISISDFEALFTAALEPIGLATLAASPEGRALCRRRGCDRDAVLRYSRAARGPVLSTELAIVAASGDAARLVALIEWIIIRLVLAGDGER